MTSLDVMLKGTDDDASSGFFHLKVSLRHRLKKTSPCLTSPRASAKPLRAWPCRVSSVSLSRRRKPGCWVILLF
ncbi:hypothetical protein [Salisediminibacterium halotolerans]|uniref:hypothetical protein n=1 Tax=Salisediminibacterium halotolerans TaxID=517425 RepID=UPI000F5059AF|nr:hypothetical protein [Salisediminibacterium halotolerans]